MRCIIERLFQDNLAVVLIGHFSVVSNNGKIAIVASLLVYGLNVVVVIINLRCDISSVSI